MVACAMLHPQMRVDQQEAAALASPILGLLALRYSEGGWLGSLAGMPGGPQRSLCSFVRARALGMRGCY